MHIIVVGANHKTAPIDYREKLAFEDSKIPEVLGKICDISGVSESVLISTCNRVEVYALAKSVKDGIESLFDFICRYHRLDKDKDFKDKLSKMIYSYADLDAIKHLFRVASSLDSMVVGETQVSGQVKAAYDISLKAKSSKEVLSRLFAKAFSVNKRVRSETNISSGAVSISYAAVELAKKIFGDISQKRVLIIGAGKMSELTLKHLISNGIKEVVVANRTFERAVKLAQNFQEKGKAVPFEENLNFMVDADIIIVSTNAPNYLVNKWRMTEIMKKRKHKPVFLIDISVPRNAEPEINNIDNVYLYNIDDLQNVVASNLGQRLKESQKAEAIIEEEADKFLGWLQSLEVNPTIIALREWCEGIREAELEKFRKVISSTGYLTKEQEEAIESMTKAIVNKLLHQPTVNLKQLANSQEDHFEYISALRALFNLEDEKDDNKSRD